MSNFVQRTLSGSVYVAVIVASVLYHPASFAVLFCLISMFAVREFCKLLQLDPWLTIMSSLSAGVLFFMHSYLNDIPSVIEPLYLLLVMLVLVAELFRKQPNPIHNWGYFLASQAMIAYPLALMNSIYYHEDWMLGRYIVLALFVCVWTNDTGAYCVGSLIGKHKMIPRVSPGKTWEGLTGGFVFSLLAGYIFSLFVPALAVWQWLLIAFTISVAGTLGDLMESLFKRTIGVKDSGTVVPGRGGWLDCFDSTLLAAPAVYLLLSVLG